MSAFVNSIIRDAGCGAVCRDVSGHRESGVGVCLGDRRVSAHEWKLTCGSGTHANRARTQRVRLGATTAAEVSVSPAPDDAKLALLVLLQQMREKLRVKEGSVEPVTPVQLRDATQRTEWKQKIERALDTLQRAPVAKQFETPLTSNPAVLDGSWRLLYSDAREITSLTKLPFGFRLVKVNQDIRLANARFENVAIVDHRWLGLTIEVRIKAQFAVEPKRLVRQSLGRAGRGIKDYQKKSAVEQRIRGSKINVQFERREISIKRIFWRWFVNWQIVNKQIIERFRVPGLIIQYIDETLRVGKGANTGGGYYVLVREPEE
ncbi:hypothetical protein FVE85_0759 [Porphyridium purpureum]|uniref:Plastid lipid-associated protein/fibrillin conserved domain-containing protein n=1 Tax=Porphyridium purpureum TaxID=35688 RepID=A0A5J4Z190_PORPP|nr:hypothetical protein FVE85_0759 [Porphyridium purpureum]|eukprot:POR6285..scf208_2